MRRWSAWGKGAPRRLKVDIKRKIDGNEEEGRARNKGEKKEKI